jgi:hypothetical protein
MNKNKVHFSKLKYCCILIVLIESQKHTNFKIDNFTKYKFFGGAFYQGIEKDDLNTAHVKNKNLLFV